MRHLIPHDEYKRHLETLMAVFVVDVFDLRDIWASPGSISGPHGRTLQRRPRKR
jgi:hypothetical protein